MTIRVCPQLSHLSLEVLHNFVVVFGVVGEGAVGADFDAAPVLVLVLGVAGAGFKVVERAIAKEAVQVPVHLVAGIVFAVFVSEEFT